MNTARHFSIMDFCQSFILCSKRPQQVKRFEDLSAKTILEKILKSGSQKKSLEKSKKYSKSTPNLTSQVKGNSSLKPTISIRQCYNINQQDFDKKNPQRLDYKSFSDNPKSKVFSATKNHKENLKNRRLKSFKNSSNFSSDKSSLQSFKSCPNLHLTITLDQHKIFNKSEKTLEMFDTVDDFTTNLFLDENLIDESNFDLVSINFDKA